MTLKPSADLHKRTQHPSELPENLDGRSRAEIKHLFQALQRRQAELEAQNQVLHEHAQRFQTLFQDAVDAIYVHDLEGNILDVNRRACEMSGYSRQELLTMHVGDIDVQYGRQKPPEIDPLADATDRTWQFKSQHRNQEGTIFPVEVHVGSLVLSGQPALVTTVQDITARVQREKALRKSKEKYRLLLESISDSVYVLDREWRHIVVNDAAERFVHIPKAQLLGGKLTDLLPGVEQTRFFETFERVMTTRQPDSVVDEFIFEDGRKRWYEVHVYPVPEGILCISRDISARVHAEEALRAKNQAHKFLADAAVKLIQLSTTDQVFTLISTSLAELLPDAIILVNKVVNDGKYLKMVDIQGLSPSTLQRVTQLIGFDPRHICFRIRENFKDIYFQAKLYQYSRGFSKFMTSLCPQPTAQAIEEFLGIRDIYSIGIADNGNTRGNVHILTTQPTTDVYPLLIESFIHQCFLSLSRISSHRRLAESERRYRTFIDASPDLIFLKDEALRYILLNQANQDLFGKTEAEIVGKTDFELMTPQMAAACRRSDQQAIAQNDLVVIRERSNDRLYETRKFPVPMRNGEMGVGGVIRDITERRQAEKALQESNRRLEQALLELQTAQAQMIQRERLAAVGQLAAGIAHDFRNLLTTIILHTHLAQHQPDLSSDSNHKLEIILDESKKAADLVQQILDFSSRSMLEAQPVDLYDLTQGVVHMLRRTLPENIRLSLNTSPGTQDTSTFRVLADPSRIEQALMNLALNARDAMPEGGELRFTLSQQHLCPQDIPRVSGTRASVSPSPADKTKARAWVCLTVSDTGTGMTEQVRAHLFEPFFTTKEVGQGTGLGLAQVYGIVRQHEGYIDVETALDIGTTFRIYLPTSDEVQKSADAKAPDTPRGRGETILLVEDNRMLRQAAQSILESLNYRVIVAANGRAASKIYAQEGKIDLVITDLVMPEMGGKALMQTLRRTTPQLKGLAITGYTVQEIPETLRQVGLLAVIHKPFQIDALARAVRHALDKG